MAEPITPADATGLAERLRLAASRKELSGIPGELRDKIAEAIRGDGSLDDRPWEALPEERKDWWREDADRVLAAIKDYLTPAPVETAPEAQQEPVKVKPLEWVGHMAKTVFGTAYTVHNRADGMYEAASFCHDDEVNFGSVLEGPHRDEAAAKAAAQADYERRILSTLTSG